MSTTTRQIDGDPHALPRMDDTLWATQPRAVWLAVERRCWASWPSRVRYASGTVVGSGVPVGWLTVERGRTLEALDCPVGRIFTACAILHRAMRTP